MASETGPSTDKVATLAAGCFWCVEAVFNMTQGVKSAISGYIGGHLVDPGYVEVKKGNSGHAECVQVTFDPEVVSYADLLQIFWKIHDPTTLNRQGIDEGTQYRSAIFYHDDKQKRIAELSLAAAQEAQLYSGPFVTKITAAGTFYPAEDYHQEYYKNNPSTEYCHTVVGPKVKKFRELFQEKLKLKVSE